MLTLEVPDGHIAYDVLGDGPAGVLLHGGGLDQRMWDRQHEAFAARHQVVRPVMRGHGGSSTATTHYRPCDDVVALLDHLALETVALVGLSYGAAVALDVALEAPERVSAVVACGGGAAPPEFVDPWILRGQERLGELAEVQDAEGWVELFTHMFFDGPHRTADDVDPAARAECAQMTAAVVARHVRPDAVPPGWTDDSWARLPEIGTPLLGVVGNLDAADHLMLVGRAMQAVPNARAFVVDGAAHYPNIEAPDAFNAEVLEFLAS